MKNIVLVANFKTLYLTNEAFADLCFYKLFLDVFVNIGTYIRTTLYISMTICISTKK